MSVHDDDPVIVNVGVLHGCLWARLKDVSNRITSIVRLLYRFGPSLTAGVLEVGLYYAELTT